MIELILCTFFKSFNELTRTVVANYFSGYFLQITEFEILNFLPNVLLFYSTLLLVTSCFLPFWRLVMIGAAE